MLLFTGKTGEPVHNTSLSHSCDAACRRVGLVGVTRRPGASCASCVAESDGALEAARRLAHSRSSITTRHYARPLAGGDRVVADRLDRARKEARSDAKPEKPISTRHVCGTTPTVSSIERSLRTVKRASPATMARKGR
jgi:hypothetical protein